VEKQVLHEMHVERALGTKEELRKEFKKRVKKVVRRMFHTPRSRSFFLLNTPH